MKKKPLKEQLKKEQAIIESFAKNFNSIKRLDEQQLDEINFRTGIATLGLAASMMGAPNDAQAQTPQQGMEKSVSDTSAADLPQDNIKAGKIILDSYFKNPFTADMWSKKSRENLMFFKMLKKIVDYRTSGGRIEYSDYEKLGAMAKQSSLATDFLQRKKEDMNTTKLKEDEDYYETQQDENKTLSVLEGILKQSNYFIEKINATPEDAFFRGAAKGAEAIKSYIEKAIQNEKNYDA